jgi:hypothetical protein
MNTVEENNKRYQENHSFIAKLRLNTFCNQTTMGLQSYQPAGWKSKWKQLNYAGVQHQTQ